MILKNTTDEYSFILKPSKHGVGVFAVHGIKKGTLLKLLGPNHDDYIERSEVDVPVMFRPYCLSKGDGVLICPRYFGQMSVEWFINHVGGGEATATSKDGIYHHAARDIEEGEEITIDYEVFGEDEHTKEAFYRKST